MKIRLLRSASADLRQTADFIAIHARRAAERLVSRIEAHLSLIAETQFVAMDRAGRRAGTREFAEGKYIVSYRHNPAQDELVVVSVVHGARRS